MTAAVEVRRLTKSFGSTTVLGGLDLAVSTGEVHGFLGPNGAGKSTTIRTLLGLIRATSGHLRVLGLDPWGDAAGLHRRLAYVPGDVTLWPALTGGEVLDLMARLRGSDDPARRARLIERFELDPRKRARTYSTGNRQKVALISALSSDAELLILDEPTSGLDPLMEIAFRECLLEQKHAGRTVLLSSHILSEVEAACDRVTIVRGGRTVETGTLTELRHLTRTTVEAQLTSIPDELRSHRDVHDLSISDHTARFQVEPAHLEAIMRVLLTGGLRDLVAHPPTLEDLFLEHYQRTPGETSHSPAGTVGSEGARHTATGSR